MTTGKGKTSTPKRTHKDVVLAALIAAKKPMTTSQLAGVTKIGKSEVRKAMRKLAAAELAHLYAWSKENAAHAWAPVWACGKGEHAQLPDGARPVAVDMPPVKEKSKSKVELELERERERERMVRTAHLTIPVTQFKTTFAGGVNPWAEGQSV